MTELEQESLKEKIAQCAEAISDLQKYRDLGSLEYFREHTESYFAVCYRFVNAIEALFDVGQLLLTSRNERAASQREIPTMLHTIGLLNSDTAARFSAMYGFRNRLVHAYGTLDDAKVVAYLHEHLDDIPEILKVAKRDLE